MNNINEHNNHYNVFTIQDALRILSDRKRLIATTFLSIFIPTILVAFLMPPLYKATATVVIKREGAGRDYSVKAARPDQATTYRNLERKAEINTYARLVVNSRTVEAIRNELDLSIELLNKIEDARRYVRYTWNWIVKTASSAYSNLKYLTRFSSPPTPEQEAFVEHQNLMRDIFQRASAVPLEESNIIQVSFESSNAHIAMKAANELTDNFLEAFSTSNDESVRSFFSNEAARLRDDISQAETEIENKKIDYSLYRKEHQRELLVSSLLQAENQLKLLEIQRDSNESQILATQLQLESEKEKVVTRSETVRDPVLQSLEMRLSAAERELVVILSEYGSQSGPVKSLEAEIDEINSQIASINSKNLVQGTTTETNPIYSTLKQRLVDKEIEREFIDSQAEGLASTISSYKDELSQLGTRSLELIAMERELNSKREAYDLHVRNRDQAKLIEEMTKLKLADVRVGDYAPFPIKPIRPRKTMYLLIGLAAALLAAIAMPFLFYFNDSTIRNKEDLLDLTHSDFVATLPDM